MKVLVCLAAILATTAAISTEVDSNRVRQVNKIKYIAANFETWTPRKQIDNINDFVDMIIIELRSFIVKYGLDPFHIPNIEETIDIADTDVAIKLTNGIVYNVSSIYREGDVGLFYENRMLVVDVPVFFKVFQLNYGYEFKIDDNATLLNGNLKGEVYVIDVKTAVQIDFSQLQITLKSFSIPSMGPIAVKFEGGMLEWIAQGVTDWATTNFKGEIVFVVEQVTKFTMDTIFNVINKVLESLKP